MPTQDKSSNAHAGGVKFILVLAGLVVIIAGIKAAADLLVPFLLAVFISLIAAAPLSWLVRRAVPSTVAALLSVVMVLLFLLGFGVIISASLGDFNRLLPEYESNLQALVANSIVWLEDHGIVVSGTLLTDAIKPAVVMSYAADTFRRLSAVLSNGFLILLLVTFILLEAVDLPRKLALLSAPGSDKMPYFVQFQQHLNKYLIIKTCMSLLTGITVGLMLWGLDVDFPLLWGLLAFLLNYIPNIGSLISAIPPLLLALVDAGVSVMIAVAIGYFAINNLYGNILEPRLMGRGLGLSTLVVFISLIFWGWVFGPVGMLLSIPLTMVLKIALETNENTKWLAILLSDHKQIVKLVTDKTEAD